MGMLGKDLPLEYAGKIFMDITHGVKLDCLYKKILFATKNGKTVLQN